MSGKAMFVSMFVLAVVLTNAPQVQAQEAKAEVINTQGESIGTVMFTQVDQGVKVTADLHSLPPGTHSFHVHQMGMCEAMDFKSCGGHFNPYGTQHGFLNPNGPHAGDLPNIVAGEDGTYRGELITGLLSLDKEAENSVLKEGGTAVIIHADADDYISDPAGNGGARIACGVVAETVPSE